MMINCCNIPLRAQIAMMLFTACAISYMLRVNMSINIIAMVKEHSNQNKTGFVSASTVKTLNNITVEELPEGKSERLKREKYSKKDDQTLYDWDSPTQSAIIGAYFWGQILSCAPGGFVAERFGATKTIFISTLIAALCTSLVPFIAAIHWGAVWFLRFLTGLMGGVIYPSLHCLISRWAPPEEKGKFIGALLGGSLGTVLTWPLLGILIERWGWPCSFFVPSVIAALWSLLWLYLVSDSPQDCSRISEAERNHIEMSLKGINTKDKVLPPYKQIFLSVAVWAFIVSHFGNSWGLYFLMTSGPKYMSTVLGFKLDSSGILSALPYLARMLFGFVFGFVGDIISKNKWMRRTTIRKSFTICSHIIPGAFLFLLTATECDVVWTITLITLSLGINGASSITNLANSQDLAPAFAGSLYGIANTVGGTTGFISSAITGYFTKDHNGIDEWRSIFQIGGSVYIVSGIIFCIFGSGENQNFTTSVQTEQDKTTSKTGIENNAFQNDEKKNDTTQI